MDEEFKRIETTLKNEYAALASEDSLKFEVNRLLRVPFVGTIKIPGKVHPKLNHLQKIMLDVAIIYRMGYCELTILACRAILEAFVRSKSNIQVGDEKGLFRQIEELQLPNQYKEKAHCIRMLGNLIAHWSTNVNTEIKVNTLAVILEDKYGKKSFEIPIPEEYSQVMDESFLFTELMATKAYNELIQVAAVLTNEN